VVFVFAISAMLLGCPLGVFRVRITDYFTRGVKGLQLYRVDSTGQLVNAGRIEFLAIESGAGGEVMKYRNVASDGTSLFGPVYTDVERNASYPYGIELVVSFSNQLPAGWFKVASYNGGGTSSPSTGQTWVANGS
jgi:hypothetical protein